jgi:DNA-3-methyladenine glycosylase
MYQMREEASQSCGDRPPFARRPDPAVAARDARARPIAVGSGLEPLGIAFYERPVLLVARDCVGKLLVCRETGVLVGKIVETEAYRGPEDRAAHSFGGRRTARTEAMFGPAGRAYVFVLYGRHHHLNLVTGSVGQPEAVLVRAVEPILGLEIMSERRNVRVDQKVLTNGPGKVCEAFAIDRSHYGRDLTRGGLFLSEDPNGRKPRVGRSPRIGVDYAGPWAQRPWRFFDRDSAYVSRARRSTS